jgi:hypothetical protein
MPAWAFSFFWVLEHERNMRIHDMALRTIEMAFGSGDGCNEATCIFTDSSIV